MVKLLIELSDARHPTEWRFRATTVEAVGEVEAMSYQPGKCWGILERPIYTNGRDEQIAPYRI